MGDQRQQPNEIAERRETPQIEIQRVQMQAYYGPLPHPEVLRAFKEIDPRAVDIANAESLKLLQRHLPRASKVYLEMIADAAAREG